MILRMTLSQVVLFTISYLFSRQLVLHMTHSTETELQTIPHTSRRSYSSFVHVSTYLSPALCKTKTLLCEMFLNASPPPPSPPGVQNMNSPSVAKHVAYVNTKICFSIRFSLCFIYFTHTQGKLSVVLMKIYCSYLCSTTGKPTHLFRTKCVSLDSV
jgi:hypothetical protein